MSFKPDPNFEAELARSVQYLEGLERAAQPAAEFAKSVAPVATGAYRDSIDVRRVGQKVYLSATDFKAWWIEYGSAHNPPSSPLRRGARAAGFSLRERGE